MDVGFFLLRPLKWCQPAPPSPPPPLLFSMCIRQAKSFLRSVAWENVERERIVIITITQYLHVVNKLLIQITNNGTVVLDYFYLGGKEMTRVKFCAGNRFCAGKTMFVDFHPSVKENGIDLDGCWLVGARRRRLVALGSWFFSLKEEQKEEGEAGNIEEDSWKTVRREL